MKRLHITTFAVVALLVAPAGAMAQSAVNTYGGEGQTPASVLGEGAAGGSGASSSAPVAGAGAGGGAGAASVLDDQAAGNNVAGNDVAGDTAAGSGPAAAASETRAVPRGSLPFTGFDVALIALGGLALVAMGFAARRVSRGTLAS